MKIMLLSVGEQWEDFGQEELLGGLPCFLLQGLHWCEGRHIEPDGWFGGWQAVSTLSRQ